MSAAAEVVWSRSRRRLWNQCPRRFRWQYYGEGEELEALRRLRGERQWAIRIAFDEIDRFLTTVGVRREVDPEVLLAGAGRRVTREWEGRGGGLLAWGANCPDDPDLHAAPGRVRAWVREWLRRFAESATARELVATPVARRRGPLRERSVEVGNVLVAAPPLWSRVTTGGEVILCAWTVTDRPAADAAEWAAAALLWCSRLGVELERLALSADHLTAEADRRWFRFDAALLIEEQNRILEDAARWRRALAAGEAGFPARAEVRRCEGCPFLRLCPEGRETVAADG